MDLVKIWGNLLANGGGSVCTIPTTYFMQGVQVFAYANDTSSSSVESEEVAVPTVHVVAPNHVVMVDEDNGDEDDDCEDDDDEDSRPSTALCEGAAEDEDIDTLPEPETAPKKRRRRIQRIRYSREEYKCTMCTYTCTTEKAFLRHLRGCESVPCGVGGADAAGGTAGPRLSCPICGRDRNGEQSILVHMKKHRDEKHFCCDLCKFRTLQLKKLIQHRRMHTGEKPHLCPFCTYRSARRDNLRSHVRRVHKKENLTCDTFTPRSMLLAPTKSKPVDD